jgi:hypothetical protein
MNTVNLLMHSQVLSQKENNCLFVLVTTLFIKTMLPAPPPQSSLCHESYLMPAGIYIQKYSPQQSLLCIEYSVYTMRMLYTTLYKSSPQKYIFARIFVEKRNL